VQGICFCDGGRLTTVRCLSFILSKGAAGPIAKSGLCATYLAAHPEDVAAYGALKNRLAREYTEYLLGHTKVKTAFILGRIDEVRAELGLHLIDV
jgi:hypothetical protein